MTYVRGDWRDHYGRQAEGRTRPALQQLGYAAFFTLGIPRAPGQRRYSSDVDAALVSGRRLVLVDVKCWDPRHLYWSAGGWLMRGDERLDRLSGNMALAVSRYADVLPHLEMSGLVMFVPDVFGRTPTATWFRWPGGIRSYSKPRGAQGAPPPPRPARAGQHAGRGAAGAAGGQPSSGRRDLSRAAATVRSSRRRVAVTGEAPSGHDCGSLLGEASGRPRARLPARLSTRLPDRDQRETPGRASATGTPASSPASSPALRARSSRPPGDPTSFSPGGAATAHAADPSGRDRPPPRDAPPQGQGPRARNKSGCAGRAKGRRSESGSLRGAAGALSALLSGQSVCRSSCPSVLRSGGLSAVWQLSRCAVRRPDGGRGSCQPG